MRRTSSSLIPLVTFIYSARKMYRLVPSGAEAQAARPSTLASEKTCNSRFMVCLPFVFTASRSTSLTSKRPFVTDFLLVYRLDLPVGCEVDVDQGVDEREPPAVHPAGLVLVGELDDVERRS